MSPTDKIVAARTGTFHKRSLEAIKVKIYLLGNITSSRPSKNRVILRLHEGLKIVMDDFSRLIGHIYILDGLST